MSGNDAPTTSPKGSDHRVQNGRIERSKRKEPKAPTYRIGGRTYACEGCKKGHRVSKCTHAGERPVSMTHDPGRPSGDQKRHCDCPKQCACTKKNCKCDRNCSCTQTMYMLVYVPIKDGESDDKPDEGEWRVDKEVVTDLHGKELTEDEVKARNERKLQQQNAKDSPPSTGPLMAKPKEVTTAASEGCCHKKNVEEQKEPAPFQQDSMKPAERRPQCNCGPGCKCAFCLDHPNNQTSHLLAQQQAAHFTNQSYGQQSKQLWAPLQVGGSCMGTSPQFAISNTPNPSFGQFQSMFPTTGPSGQRGYFISYPFTRLSPFLQSPYIEPLQSPPVDSFQQTPMLAKSEVAIPETPTPAPAASCCHPSTLDDVDFSVQQQTSLPGAFDFTDYDIGDAVTARWHRSPNNPFSYDLGFDQELDSFSNPLPDLNILPSPDIMNIIQPISLTQATAPMLSEVQFDHNLTETKHFSALVPTRPSSQDHMIIPNQVMQSVETNQPIPLQVPGGCYHHPCCHHGQVQNFSPGFCNQHRAHPTASGSSNPIHGHIDSAFGETLRPNSFPPVELPPIYAHSNL